ARTSLPVDLVARLLEDGTRIRDPVGEPQCAAQLEGDLTAPPGVGEELETGPQVAGRGWAVRPPLGQAELDKHLSPRHRIQLLLERPGKVPDRRLRPPPADRPPA